MEDASHPWGRCLTFVEENPTLGGDASRRGEHVYPWRRRRTSRWDTPHPRGHGSPVGDTSHPRGGVSHPAGDVPSWSGRLTPSTGYLTAAETGRCGGRVLLVGERVSRPGGHNSARGGATSALGGENFTSPCLGARRAPGRELFVPLGLAQRSVRFALFGFRALFGRQQTLAQPEADGRHLHQLVALDEVHRLLQAQPQRRRQPHRDV